MSDPTAAPRTARVIRAGAASALGVLVALAAHLAGGGSAPPLALLLAAAVLVQPVAVLLAGSRPRLWRQAAVVGVGQLAMHAAFALGSATTGVQTAAGMEAMPGMHGSLPVALPALTALPPMHPDHGSTAMQLWHGVAWLLTTAAWRWGEAAVRRLRTAVRRAVPRAVRLPRPLGGVLLRPATAPAVPARPAAVRAADPRRGPPSSR